MSSTQIDFNNPDPQALALTHAIALQESGQNGKPNYNAKGDAGTSSGAYQWQPGNFEAAAKNAGLDPTDFSPLNQDKVAYSEVKAYKDKGYDPGQIASLWNSGSPNNWQNHSGTTTINGQKINYDTPAYVQGVKKYYQELSVQNSSKNSNFVNPNQTPQTSNFVTPPAPTPAVSTPDVPKQDFLQSVLSGAQNIGKSIASPILGVASIPFQAGLAGYNAITGQHIEDPTQQGGIPVAGLGNTPVTPLDLEKKAGDIAQVAGMALPGTGVLGTIGQGALMGGGQALSQGGDIGTVLGNTAVGGATGAILGAGAKYGGKLIESAGNVLSGKAATEAVNGIKDAYGSALNLSAGERAFENKTGKDLAQVLLDYKAPLGRYENGTLDASGAIAKLEPELEKLNTQATQILSHPQGVVNNINLSDIFSEVKNRINDSTMSATQAKTMISQATNFLKDEASKYGSEVTPEIANNIKQGFQNSVFKKALTTSDQLNNNVQYLLSDAFKNATEKSVAGTDAGDVLGALNKQRSNLIDAVKRLTKLDGVKLLKGGKLGNMAGGLTGTIIGGSTGNPALALAGDYFGTKAAEFLNNPATKIAGAELKQKAVGYLPKLLGNTAEPIGGAVSKVGNVISRGSRPAGLLGSLLLGKSNP